MNPCHNEDINPFAKYMSNIEFIEKSPISAHTILVDKDLVDCDQEMSCPCYISNETPYLNSKIDGLFDSL